MAQYRRKRLELVRIVLGGHWNESAVPERMPLNMMELTLRVWSRNLIARAPKARVTSRRREVRPVVVVLQHAPHRQGGDRRRERREGGAQPGVGRAAGGGELVGGVAFGRGEGHGAEPFLDIVAA